MTVLQLKPEIHEKIWGGTRLAQFGYELPSNRVGEAWVVAAHENGVSTIVNGEFTGQSLQEVWENHPELFGGHEKNEKFPLLVKILDAHENLSIQVHPNDEQSLEKFGKTESWYILDAEPGAQLFYGHHAQTKEALEKEVADKNWSELLRTIPVKKGDFFYVPAGTFHALGAGVLALEIQQSSDTTYRFYDFDRVDATTNQLRPLQIDEALAVTKVPHQDPILSQETRIQDSTIITRLLTSPKFTIDHLSVRGLSYFQQKHQYELLNVISGHVTLVSNHETYHLQKGDNAILIKDSADYTLDGDGEVMISFVTPDNNSK